MAAPEGVVVRRRGAVSGLLAAVAIAPVILLAAPPAAASCMTASPLALLDEQPVAFVGTVVAQRSERVRLEVDQVWRGPDLAPHVWIIDDGDDVGELLEWAPGTTHLVLTDGAFHTNDCLAAPVATLDGMTAARPNSPRLPVEGGEPGAPGGIPAAAWVGGGLGVMAVAVFVVRAYRSRRRNRHTASAMSTTT